MIGRQRQAPDASAGDASRTIPGDRPRLIVLAGGLDEQELFVPEFPPRAQLQARFSERHLHDDGPGGFAA